ncbi:MAG: DUF5357 family protein [bacterium]
MKKNLSWKTTLSLSVVSYLLSYLIGGIIGEALNFLGLILLLLGIVGYISSSSKGNKKIQ